VLGGLSGAAVAVAGRSRSPSASFLVAGAIAGAFAGYEVRKRLVRALKFRILIALLEDAVAMVEPLNCVAF